MKFYINSESGSGMKFSTKEEFLEEISLMIDDCIENGGTFFSVDYEADASCFYIEEETNCELGIYSCEDCFANGNCERQELNRN